MSLLSNSFRSDLWICILLWMGARISATAPTLEEHCHYDTFNPSCDPGQVLLVQSASYGRMAMGKCVKTDFGFIGCFVDVLHILDHDCSGRSSCSLEVVDPTFAGIVPCHDAFKNYLRVTYSCLQVPTLDASTCRLMLSDTGEEVIPGGMIRTTSCGTATRPLTVEVKQGQKINVTLLDFNPRLSRTAPPRGNSPIPQVIDMPPVCYRYGQVFDGEPTDDVHTHFRSEGRDICRSEVRESLVMSSNSNILSLQFSKDKSSNFALRFTAWGCPQLVPRECASISQDTVRAKVECENTNRVWNLVCQGNEWIGQTGNCTCKGTDRSTNRRGSRYKPFSLSSAWTSLVALGVAIIIGLIILIVGLFCWRRLRRKERNPRQLQLTTDNTPMYQTTPSQNLDNSDGELDLLTHTDQQRTPCLYCRAASEHYAPFREIDKGSLPRQTIYSAAPRTLERPVMPPDLYSCNVKTTDGGDERIKILSDLNVAYDRLPQSIPRKQTEVVHSFNKNEREHRILKDI